MDAQAIGRSNPTHSTIAGLPLIHSALNWVPRPIGPGVSFSACLVLGFHSASLVMSVKVAVSDGSYAIELAPVPDRDGQARGVVGGGPVVSKWLGGLPVTPGTGCTRTASGQGTQVPTACARRGVDWARSGHPSRSRNA
jgi:hypothetical protein